jgi:hypothetical protein
MNTNVIATPTFRPLHPYEFFGHAEAVQTLKLAGKKWKDVILCIPRVDIMNGGFATLREDGKYLNLDYDKKWKECKYAAQMLEESNGQHDIYDFSLMEKVDIQRIMVSTYFPLQIRTYAAMVSVMHLPPREADNMFTRERQIRFNKDSWTVESVHGDPPLMLQYTEWGTHYYDFIRKWKGNRNPMERLPR